MFFILSFLHYGLLPPPHTHCSASGRCFVLRALFLSSSDFIYLKCQLSEFILETNQNPYFNAALFLDNLLLATYLKNRRLFLWAFKNSFRHLSLKYAGIIIIIVMPIYLQSCSVLDTVYDFSYNIVLLQQRPSCYFLIILLYISFIKHRGASLCSIQQKLHVLKAVILL